MEKYFTKILKVLAVHRKDLSDILLSRAEYHVLSLDTELAVVMHVLMVMAVSFSNTFSCL